MLDVVEGTALEALHGMNALISSRPTGFESIEKAIEWQYAVFPFFSKFSPDDWTLVVCVRRLSRMLIRRGYRFRRYSSMEAKSVRVRDGNGRQI